MVILDFAVEGIGTKQYLASNLTRSGRNVKRVSMGKGTESIGALPGHDEVTFNRRTLVANKRNKATRLGHHAEFIAVKVAEREQADA